MKRDYMRGRVSIIVPCYNITSYKQTVFRSIINQSYRDYEIIAVDDGSIDETSKILRKYKNEFEEIGKPFLLLRHEKNRGASSAINTALQYVRGEFLLWPDSDDELPVDSVMNHVKKFSDESIAISMGEVLIIDEESGKNEITNVRSEDVIDNLFWELVFSRKSPIQTAGYMVRMKSLDDCLNDRRIYETRFGQNVQMLLPIAYGNRCAVVHKVVYQYNSSINGDYRSKISRFDSHMHRQEFWEDCVRNTIRTILLNRDDKWRIACSIEKLFYAERLNVVASHEKLDDLKIESRQLFWSFIDRDYCHKNAKGRNVWIWGNNYWGELYKRFLEEEGINIIGFIDKRNDIQEDKLVIHPDQIGNYMDKIFIFITMRRVYDDVIIRLNNLNMKSMVDYYYFQNEL